MTLQFLSRDPSHSAFWDERFQQGFTPWDRGAVPVALRDFVSQLHATQATTPNCLIPGCGHAYELGFLSDANWDVTAIDFSSVAVATAQAQVGHWANRIQQADFFQYQPERVLSIIYERAFFCALPASFRLKVVERWATLLPTGAKLIGFFFIDEDPSATKKGPPFRIHPQDWATMMQPFFVCLEDSAVLDSLPVFEGKERWQIWQRR